MPPSKSEVRKLLQRQQQFVAVETRRALEEAGERLFNRHQNIVKEWTHKPKFTTRLTISGDESRVDIMPMGKFAAIWGYVDRGTKPHKIRAKNGGFLRFQTDYSARTAPIARANQGTGRAAGAWRSKREVNHPGIKARKFTITLLERLNPPLPERIQAAVVRGVQKANQ